MTTRCSASGQPLLQCKPRRGIDRGYLLSAMARKDPPESASGVSGHHQRKHAGLVLRMQPDGSRGGRAARSDLASRTPAAAGSRSGSSTTTRTEMPLGEQRANEVARRTLREHARRLGASSAAITGPTLVSMMPQTIRLSTVA